jgi:hypothetical protein
MYRSANGQQRNAVFLEKAILVILCELWNARYEYFWRAIDLIAAATPVRMWPQFA